MKHLALAAMLPAVLLCSCERPSHQPPSSPIVFSVEDLERSGVTFFPVELPKDLAIGDVVRLELVGEEGTFLDSGDGAAVSSDANAKEWSGTDLRIFMSPNNDLLPEHRYQLAIFLGDRTGSWTPNLEERAVVMTYTVPREGMERRCSTDPNAWEIDQHLAYFAPTDVRWSPSQGLTRGAVAFRVVVERAERGGARSAGSDGS